MDLCLDDIEMTRMSILQDLFPDEDFGNLLEVAKTHLKTERSFQNFLNGMLNQKKEREKTESDIEDDETIKNLKMSLMSHINQDPALESEVADHNGRIKGNSFFKGQINGCSSSNYVDEKDEELSQLIYGFSNSKKNKNVSEESVESDSDSASFHSLEEETNHYCKVGVKKSALNTAASNSFSDKKETSEQTVFDDQKEEKKGMCGNDKLEERKETLNNETEEPEIDFSYFNSLINFRKMEENGFTSKPDSEKREAARKTEETEKDVEKTEGDVNLMIEHFFMQENYAKKRSTSEERVKRFEEKGAIPKRMGSTSNRSDYFSGDITRSVANSAVVANVPENEERKNISVPKRSIPVVEENKLSVENSSVKKEDNFALPKEKFNIPNSLFVYVVPENPSPNFSLPKGNYYVIRDLDLNFLLKNIFVVRHPEEITKTEESTSKKPEKSWVDPASKNFDESSSTRTAKSKSDFPSLPSQRAFDPKGNHTIKINRSEVKAKIFCNTPLQSLKKDGENKIDSADAYGAILQSVANDSGSADKSEKRIENFKSETEPFEVSSKSLFFKSDRSSDTQNCYGFSTEKTCKAETDFSFEYESTLREADSKIAEDIDSSTILQVIKMLKNAEPEEFTNKLKECKGVSKTTKCAIKEREEHFQVEEIYNKLLLELPELDPEYLFFKSKELNGNEKATGFFIQEEKVKLQLKEIKNKLAANFPFFDKEFLEEKSNEFLCDPDGLSTFIHEEKRKLKIEEQFELMLNSLPGIDPLVLRQKSEESEGDAEKIRKFIAEKSLEMEKEEEKNIQIMYMHSILPDADPEFLQQKHEELSGNPNAFNVFLYELLDSKDYPKIQQDDPAVQERNELWKRFVQNFTVEDFLTKVPNPEETYSGSKNDNNKTDIGLILKFLQSRYPDLAVTELEKVFQDRRCNLTNTCAQLDFRHRPIEIMDPSFRNENISESFLLELVFLLRRREIRDYIREEKSLRKLKLEKAKNENSLLNCLCCFDDELLDTDVATCPEGHIFCTDCITRCVETKLSDGLTKFQCLTENCAEEFLLATLEKVLPPGLYGKVLRKKQSAEVNEAEVPGLESCPACDFAYIPNEFDKLFKCQNQDCLRETCRKCKEENHIPLRCEEVERPTDTKIRIEIEEKMTEALVRTCPKCSKKFVKTDGCNKMTCTCGTVMCYLCRKIVPNYSHFNGQGGDRFDLCPLWSTNEDLHVNRVREEGLRARDEALRQNPDLHLVHDPTKTI